MGRVVIRVENLSKQYRLGKIGTGSLGHDLNRWWYAVRGKEDPYLKIGEENDRNRKNISKYVWALKDISFEIQQGDVIGIIGRNGAGKSTLLKILSRTTLPSVGSVKIKGRMASLLEVGTGFHPELTGRENIFLNGAILGMKRLEIKSKFDEIVDFSGVEKYIDTPVKRYSSGMYVRLAFAVAAHLEPEILIVDEVLAVGDSEFQKKALGKMESVSKGEGRTVLFVSHNMGAISQLCKKGIFLRNGLLKRIGPVEEIVQSYLESSYSSEMEVSFQAVPKMKAQVLNAKLVDDLGRLRNEFAINNNPIFELTYIINERVKGFHVAIILYDNFGNHIYSTADTDLDPELLDERQPGEYKAKVNIPTMSLNVGRYNVSVGMGIINGEVFHRVDVFSFNIVDVGDFGTGKEGDRRKGLLLVQNRWNYA